MLARGIKPHSHYAFDDAVRFFRYNANATGFRQFRTLEDYLFKVGNKNAFDALRYWAIGEPPQGRKPYPVFIPSDPQRDTLRAMVSFLA